MFYQHSFGPKPSIWDAVKKFQPVPSRPNAQMHSGSDHDGEEEEAWRNNTRTRGVEEAWEGSWGGAEGSTRCKWKRGEELKILAIIKISPCSHPVPPASGCFAPQKKSCVSLLLSAATVPRRVRAAVLGHHSLTVSLIKKQNFPVARAGTSPLLLLLPRRWERTSWGKGDGRNRLSKTRVLSKTPGFLGSRQCFNSLPSWALQTQMLEFLGSSFLEVDIIEVGE